MKEIICRLLTNQLLISDLYDKFKSLNPEMAQANHRKLLGIRTLNFLRGHIFIISIVWELGELD